MPYTLRADLRFGIRFAHPVGRLRRCLRCAPALALTKVSLCLVPSRDSAENLNFSSRMLTK